MQIWTLNHIEPATYSTLNPHMFTTCYYYKKLGFNKLAADSKTPATEEVVRSNTTLFLTSSKHRNVNCFEKHTVLYSLRT